MLYPGQATGLPAGAVLLAHCKLVAGMHACHMTQLHEARSRLQGPVRCSWVHGWHDASYEDRWLSALPMTLTMEIARARAHIMQQAHLRLKPTSSATLHCLGTTSWTDNLGRMSCRNHPIPTPPVVLLLSRVQPQCQFLLLSLQIQSRRSNTHTHNRPEGHRPAGRYIGPASDPAPVSARRAGFAADQQDSGRCNQGSRPAAPQQVFGAGCKVGHVCAYRCVHRSTPAATPAHMLTAAGSPWLWCRRSLPEDHPLCTASTTASFLQQAHSLGRLHKHLHAGSTSDSCYLVQRYMQPRMTPLLHLTADPEGELTAAQCRYNMEKVAAAECGRFGTAGVPADLG